MTDKMVIEHEPYNQTGKDGPEQYLMKRNLPRTGVLETYKDNLAVYLPEHLSAQLGNHMELLKNYNEKLPEHLRRTEKDFIMIEHLFASFLVDRNRRAEEVKTARYHGVVQKALSILPTRIYQRLCGDGRVKSVHTNGFTAKIASAIRSPGARLGEFVRHDGKLTLEENSNYAIRLDETSAQYEFSTQNVDSHMVCAARTREEEATGNYVGVNPKTGKAKDFGLYRDVIEKAEEIEASQNYLRNRSKEKDNIFFIQTSFNPITGYTYMGLETPSAIRHAKDKARKLAKEKGKDPERAARYAIYTKDVLKELILEGKIISTGKLILESPIREAFEREYFEADRINNYVETSEKFWDKVELLWEEIGPAFKERVLKIYPHLDKENRKSKLELDTRAILLLTNAFNAYIHNKDHNVLEYLSMDDHDYEMQGHYVFDKHDEALVKISEGGHPPYHIPAFVVYSKDLKDMSGSTELFAGLIRNNRREGRVIDMSGQFIDPEEFAEAPIPIVAQEIVRDEKSAKVEPEDWKKLEEVNWDDMPKNWNTMGEEEFRKYLKRIKGINSVILTDAIIELRKKMATLYEPGQQTGSHLRNLYKMSMAILSGNDRETHIIVPFIKVGREENGHTTLAA